MCVRQERAACGDAGDVDVAATSTESDTDAPACATSPYVVLRKDYADYREALRRLFNQVDPMALSQGGAPHDEYDPEISDLLKWRKAVTPKHVAEAFQRWFGMPITEADAARLAEGIAQIREDFGYADE